MLTDGRTDWRTDGQKIGRLYRTLLQAGAIMTIYGHFFNIIFGIHLWTVLYPKPCYNEPCYEEVNVYSLFAIYPADFRHINIC